MIFCGDGSESCNPTFLPIFIAAFLFTLAGCQGTGIKQKPIIKWIVSTQGTMLILRNPINPGAIGGKTGILLNFRLNGTIVGELAEGEAVAAIGKVGANKLEIWREGSLSSKKYGAARSIFLAAGEKKFFLAKSETYHWSSNYHLVPLEVSEEDFFRYWL